MLIRKNRVEIKLNDVEYEILKEYSRVHGTTFASALRELCLKNVVKDLPRGKYNPIAQKWFKSLKN